MSGAVKYAGAIGIAILAVALRWALIPWVGPDAPYATLIGAVAIVVIAASLLLKREQLAGS